MRTPALGIALLAAACGSSARSTAVSNAAVAAAYQVVLVPAGTGYGQLACWDPSAKRVVDAPACLASAEPTPVLLGVGGELWPTTRKTTQVYCEIEEGMSVPGFDLSTDASPSILIYPATAKVGLTIYDDSADHAATDDQRAAAVRVVQMNNPGLVDTAARAAGAYDLDGDGTLDTLLHVSGTMASDDVGTSYEALYADFGDDRLVELFRETGTPAGGIRINATMDLGGDGRTELFVSGWWNGGGRDQLVSMSRDRVVTAVGKIGCDS